MKTILLVEDNEGYRGLLSSELEKEGYTVDAVDSSIKGMEQVALKDYDLIISDLKLPVLSGISFIESVKNVKPKTLCMILTGDPDDISEANSLDSNVDLYLEKSKSLELILKYIAKLLEEGGLAQETMLTSKSENLVMNTSQRSVVKDNRIIELTNLEYEMLKLLLENKNMIVSRRQFLSSIWGSEQYDDAKLRLVDSHIKKIRDKLNSFSIMTVRGHGYKWNEYE